MASWISSSGVDAADFDGDGWQDLFVSNIDQESFSLYRNLHDETFTDIAFAQGIAQSTRLLSGWGLKFFDHDNDGYTDLIFASGHPDDMVENYSPGVKYREPLLLFHQESGRLRNRTAAAGPAFAHTYTARGLAVGDLDNDGRLDLLIANNGAAPLLLKNQGGQANHWLGLKLVGTHSKLARASPGPPEAFAAAASRPAEAAISLPTIPAKSSASAPPQKRSGWKCNGQARTARPNGTQTCPLDATQSSPKSNH